MNVCEEQIGDDGGEEGYGAGEGNRTLIASLEGWSFTTKLHPHQVPWFYSLWRGKSRNSKSRAI